MTVSHGRVETFHDDQLIVALPHLNILASELNRLGVSFAAEQRHEPLGLARLSGLMIPGHAIEQLRHNVAIQQELAAYEKERGDEIRRPAAALEVLARGLRLQFAHAYDGWVPVFGKNRGQLAAFPHVGGTPPAGSAAGDPEPAVGSVTFADSGRGSGVRIGLLDTRIYPASPLTGRYFARARDVIDPDDDRLYAGAGHGTFVASSILRQAPAAELDVRSVLGDNAVGDAWEVAKAMAEMADAGADILNLSFGQCSTDDDRPPLVIETAVNLVSRRTVIVAAAGNHGDPRDRAQRDGSIGPTAPVWPAACLGVVAAGALDQAGRRAAFSPDVPWVSVLATAVGVTGEYLRGEVVIPGSRPEETRTEQFGGAAEWSGTSFAAAAVSGRIAAGTIPGIRSAREALNELLEPGAAGASGSGGIQFRLPGR